VSVELAGLESGDKLNISGSVAKNFWFKFPIFAATPQVG
jgi:hypothetical protein